MDIALIGEAYGEHEERERRPFVGPTGWELNRMLAQAGINRKDCFLTNVFNIRPPGNKIEYFCGPKESAIPGYPALYKGYVQREWEGELERLFSELCEVNPNIVVCLGVTASWAMLGKSIMKSIRGTVHTSTHTVTGFKVIPTYHPAAIFRQWHLRAVAIADLIKAKRESEYPEIRRPERKIWIEPTLEDLYEFDRKHLQSCERLAVDIETYDRGITCIGYAPQSDLAIVIPGIGYKRSRRPYWPSMDHERKVWEFHKDVLSRPVPKIFQNGLYDIAFIWRTWKLPVMNADHDTMLLHHALYPESLKSLGFLGSIYTDEGSWKQMREKIDTIKRED